MTSPRMLGVGEVCSSRGCWCHISCGTWGIGALVNLAVQSFKESVGESRAHVIFVEKSWEDFATEDFFHANLACEIAVQVR